ncbi:putative ATP-dependent DNA helicase [metagenome]|uniref:Putative ATP-dependent DNA helicase n=1 Tax=metagenome TaxID=256318 RepID=A0A2P2CC81_9ZZZZ
MPTPTHPDLDLDGERHHHSQAREQLARMRARTASMDSAAAGDWVSRAYLDSTFALRMQQLADDPTIPLFFGRITYGLPADSTDSAGSTGDGGETFHIGRRHISDPDGDPLVIDWRAPVSLPFYRASRTEPLGLERRRRFGFQAGVLTAYEDEDLTSSAEDDYSELLEAEIERPRVGPMRDIVATIQPEQDVIVRASLNETICVQGAPGTGKTAVGLHRAAYLLYAHREQLSRQGVLVVGPNASFLRYIADVLPALGEIDASQTTIEQLVGKATAVRGEETAAVATLKGDARLALVLERALWSHLRAPTEGLVVPRGSSRWRVPAYEAEDIVAELRTRGVRYGAARAMLPHALAHRILVKMENAGDSPDDRVQNAVARSAPVKAYARSIWPTVEPDRLVHRLLSEPGFLATAAEGVLDPDEQRLLLWARPPRSAGTARWTLADAVLIDEAADLVERTGSVAHLVVDEAQDLSAMMLRALGRRCSTGSMTILGDLAQATTPWGSRSWVDALTHLGKPGAHVEQLTRGFRVPGEVIEYAATLLPHIAVDLEPPTSVRRSRGDLAFGALSELRTRLDAIAGREGSIGLIVPDALIPVVTQELTGLQVAVVGAAVEEDPFLAHLDLVPASLAKGLEYDHVVLVEPAAVVSGEPDRVTGLRRLYVCLTRAVSSLVVLHDLPLPTELDARLVA